LALFVYGLLCAGHVHLPKIALYLPIPGPIKNAQQRLERFLQNRHVTATRWYLGLTKALLKRFAGGEIELILDATDLCDRNPMLFVAARYRGRAFPLLWRMLPADGCSPFREQKALLSQVAPLVPAHTRVVLMADQELGNADMIQKCFRKTRMLLFVSRSWSRYVGWVVSICRLGVLFGRKGRPKGADLAHTPANTTKVWHSGTSQVWRRN
jgi:hypothetical protein